MKKINKIKKLNKIILLSLIDLFPNISLNLIKYIDFLDCFDWTTLYNRYTFLSFICYNTILTDNEHIPHQNIKIIEYLSQNHDVINKEDCLNIELCIEYFYNIYSKNKLTYDVFPSLKDIGILKRIIEDSTNQEDLENNISKYTLESLKTVLNYKDMYNRPLFVWITNYDLLESLCTKGIINKKDFYSQVIYREKDNVPLYKIILDNINGEYVEEFLEKYIGLATGDCIDEEKTHNEHIKLSLKNNIINYEVVLKYLL
jgi:hypothetical protein